MNNKLITKAIAVLFLFLPIIVHSNDVEDIKQGAKFLNTRAKYQEVMNEFVALAARGDVEAMVAMLTPTVKTNSDPMKLRAYYIDQIIPFFKDHQKIHKVSTVARAFDKHGHYGWTYYTYSISNDGKTRPFAIQMLEENGKLGVGIIIVNRCFKQFQPLC